MIVSLKSTLHIPLLFANESSFATDWYLCKNTNCNSIQTVAIMFSSFVMFQLLAIKEKINMKIDLFCKLIYLQFIS